MALGDANVALAGGAAGAGSATAVGYDAERHEPQAREANAAGGDEPRHAGGEAFTQSASRDAGGGRGRNDSRFARGAEPAGTADAGAQNAKNCLWSQKSSAAARTNDGSRGAAAIWDRPRIHTRRARQHGEYRGGRRGCRRHSRVPYSQRSALAVGIHGAAQDVGRRRAPTARGGSRVVEGRCAFRARRARLDHLLAIRHLSSRDLSVEIAEEIKAHGVRVEAARDARAIPARARVRRRIRHRAGTLRARTTRVSRNPLSSPSLPRTPRAGRRMARASSSSTWRCATTGSSAARRSVEQIVAQARPLPRGHPAESAPSRHTPARVFLVATPDRQRVVELRHPRHALRPRHRHLAHRSSAPAPRHRRGRRRTSVLGYAHAGFLSTARCAAAKNDVRGVAILRAANPGFELTIGRTASAPAPPCSSRNSFASSRGDRARNPFADVPASRACPSCFSKELSESCRAAHHHRRSQRGRRPARQRSKVSERQAQIVGGRGGSTAGVSKMARDHRAVPGCAAPSSRRRVRRFGDRRRIPAPRPTAVGGAPKVRSRAVSAARRDASTWTTPLATRRWRLAGWRTFAAAPSAARPALVLDGRLARRCVRCDAAVGAGEGRSRCQDGEHKRALIAGCVDNFIKFAVANSLGRAEGSPLRRDRGKPPGSRSRRLRPRRSLAAAVRATASATAAVEAAAATIAPRRTPRIRMT